MAAARRSLLANESDFEGFVESKARDSVLPSKRKRAPECLGMLPQAKGVNDNEFSQDLPGCSNGVNTAQNKRLFIENDSTNNYSRELVIYPSDHSGPVFVLVDTSQCELFRNQKIKSGMGLYQHIRHLNIPDIELIEAVGVTLYKVTFLNVKAANNFVKNDKIIALKLKPFIPRTSIETYGVIRGVATYLTDKEILKNIRSDIKVLSIYRFQRRAADGTGFVPTTTVKIGFSGASIPKNVILEYSRFEVSHFFPPVRQCRNCGRIGHTIKGCRSGKRCLQCGKADGCSPPCEVIKCILCGDASHSSDNKSKCSVWKKENEINEIKTIKKISRKEVLKMYFTSENRFSLLQVEEGDFPPLSPVNDTTVNSDIVVNKIRTKHSFSNVVKKNNPKPKESFQPKSKSTGAIPKPTNTPCFNKEGYVVSSQLEKVLSEVLKLARAAFVKLQDNDALQQLASLDKIKDKILIGSDMAQMSQKKVISYDDLDSYTSI